MAEEFRIDVDAEGPLRMIRDAIKAVETPQITYAVRDAAQVFVRGIEQRAPRRSGRLARSFRLESLGPTEYEVSSELEYAHVHEFGAFIKPKNATRLKFSTGGGVTFSRGVRIPARPYVEPTFVAEADRAAEAFADRVERNISAG